MKLYEGARTNSGIVEVMVDGQPLDPRLDIRSHSPTGFETGYCGSGPAQLALALLADALGDDELAQQHYQKFKFEKIARIDESPWFITQAEVRHGIDCVLRQTGEVADRARTVCSFLQSSFMAQLGRSFRV